MKRRISPQVWMILVIGVIVIAGFALLLTFLNRGAGPPSAPPPISSPKPTPDPIVASVNERPIHQSRWQQAVLLDQILSDIAGQAAPTPEDTLQRLINQELILSIAPLTQTPTIRQVNDMIGDFQDAWGIDAEALDEALKAGGLSYQVFEQTIQHQLAVQASIEVMANQGENVQAWLEEQRDQAVVVIHEEHLTLPESIAQLGEPYPSESPPATPPANAAAEATVAASPLATPTSEPTPFPPTPTPEPVAAIPETAPDFSLQRADGGIFTFTEQLAQGPVVLVFFQHCG